MLIPEKNKKKRLLILVIIVYRSLLIIVKFIKLTNKIRKNIKYIKVSKFYNSIKKNLINEFALILLHPNKVLFKKSLIKML